MQAPILIGTAFTGGGAPSTFWVNADGKVYRTWPSGSFAGDAYSSVQALLGDWQDLAYQKRYPQVVSLLVRAAALL